MLARNGAGPNLCGDRGEAGLDFSAGKQGLNSRRPKKPQAYELRYCTTRVVLRVVPAENGSPLYRIEWPDIGLSDPANLSRCRQAAIEWAEQCWLTDHRNLSVAQRLKSLDNFSWSSSPVRQNQWRAA
jgi:hypothetical protein